MSDRTILSVPFEEKGRAKALGARWDPGARIWWISNSINSAPFPHWIPNDPGTPVLFPAQRTLCFDDLDDVLRYPALTVYFAPDICWRCRHKSWVLALNCHDHNDQESPYPTTLDQVLWPETIPALLAAYCTLNISPIGTLKPRFSNTLKAEYFSQGCAHCDALFGDYFLLHDFWPQLYISYTTYPIQASLPWPVQEAIETAGQLRIQKDANPASFSDDPE